MMNAAGEGEGENDVELEGWGIRCVGRERMWAVDRDHETS